MRKKIKQRKQEKICKKHKWASLLAEHQGKTVTTKIKICLECGEMKVGAHSVKISVNRMAFSGTTKLQIPVGTNMFS